MKTSRIWAATGFLLASLGSGAANAQSADFVFTNNTQFTVRTLHFWPTVRDYRGPDRLGAETMESGESYAFSPHDGGCVYSIRIELQEYEHVEQWDDINLCNLYRLTLQYNYRSRNLSLGKD